MYSDDLLDALEEDLVTNPDFVRIAGRWFPRTLLIDINLGHLNIAEAVLDMAGGGPLPTQAILDQVEISSDVNQKLLEFSMDLALQEDARFDEIGPAGDTLWYLQRLEPAEVINSPVFLRYQEIEGDRALLTDQMLELEQSLDDELSPFKAKTPRLDEVEVRLIFPHWRRARCRSPPGRGTSSQQPMKPPGCCSRWSTARRARNSQAGWCARSASSTACERWYESHGVIPGSIINVKRGKILARSSSSWTTTAPAGNGCARCWSARTAARSSRC